MSSKDNKSEDYLVIEPTKTALLILHWQKDIAMKGFEHSGNTPERLAAAHTIEHTQSVLRLSREKGVLVVYVNASHRQGYPEVPPKCGQIFRNVVVTGAHIRGSIGAEVIDALKPLDNEIIVYNYNPSSFCYTDLDLILRNKGIIYLVLSGLSTNWVVETTARHGACLGYFIYTLRDCCNSSSDEMHNWSVENILPKLGAVIDSETYISALKDASAKSA
jgi:ureidoacrylate peracid hydrolase